MNRIIYKEIEYDGIYGKEIIPWINIYAKVGIENGIVIINIEEGKLIKRIKLDNTYAYGIKKIKINEKRESLIIADSKNNISLYSI